MFWILWHYQALRKNEEGTQVWYIKIGVFTNLYISIINVLVW